MGVLREPDRARFNVTYGGTRSDVSYCQSQGHSRPNWAARVTSDLSSIATEQRTLRFGSFVPIAVMVEPEAMRSRVPQEFHEGSVFSASGQAWQGNERGWQIRAGGSSQVDVIDVQARR
jgi:hypothetical protein